HPHRTLGIVLTSIGGVAIATGLAVGALALSHANDAPTQDGPESDRAKRFALVSDGIVALGAASAVTGVVLLLWRRHERPEAPRAVVVESLAPQLRVRF
ncbi:MAG: hypothetical protein RLZZ450_5166, partial [Pseudomonadota bacterium]